jgi:CRP-like cAMP-binding protein
MSDVLTWSAGLPELVFADEDEIIVEGQPHDEILVLVHGAVRISKDGALISVIDEPGALLGEVSVLLGRPATASVIAVGDCVLRRFAQASVQIRHEPELLHAVATALAARLDLLTLYLADLVHQYGDSDSHLALVSQVLSSLSGHAGDAVEPGSEREPDAPY